MADIVNGSTVFSCGRPVRRGTCSASPCSLVRPVCWCLFSFFRLL